MPSKQAKPIRKAFRGDVTHSLPKEMREPYRLWFEYLKTALKDSTISVDRTIYEAWGDVENADFKTWWENHWRELFAVPSKTVAVLHMREEVESALADPDYLLVRVPISLQARLRDKALQLAIKNKVQSNPKTQTFKSEAAVRHYGEP